MSPAIASKPMERMAMAPSVSSKVNPRWDFLVLLNCDAAIFGYLHILRSRSADSSEVETVRTGRDGDTATRAELKRKVLIERDALRVGEGNGGADVRKGCSAGATGRLCGDLIGVGGVVERDVVGAAIKNGVIASGLHGASDGADSRIEPQRSGSVLHKGKRDGGEDQADGNHCDQFANGKAALGRFAAKRRGLIGAELAHCSFSDVERHSSGCTKSRE